MQVKRGVQKLWVPFYGIFLRCSGVKWGEKGRERERYLDTYRDSGLRVLGDLFEEDLGFIQELHGHTVQEKNLP